MESIRKVFGEEYLKSKSVVVLTKGNKLSADLQEEESKKQTMDFVRDWAKAFRKQYPDLVDIPVEVAGRAKFNSEGDMTHITDIDGSTEWLNSMWNTVATKARGRKALTALMCHICKRQLERIRRRGRRQQTQIGGGE